MSSTSDRHVLGLWCRRHVQLNAGVGQCPDGDDRGLNTRPRSSENPLGPIAGAMAAEQVTDWIAPHQRFHCSAFEPAKVLHNINTHFPNKEETIVPSHVFFDQKPGH